MEADKILELITKYNEGAAEPSEIVLIEKLIGEGQIEISQLHTLHQLQDQLVSGASAVPSTQMDERFYAMLAKEKKKARLAFRWKNMQLWASGIPKPVMAAAMLIPGFIAGLIAQPSGRKEEVKALSKQVSTLQEMVMLSLLEKESATERLRAVGLAQEMDEASNKVTRALLQTLNEDENINVRLAALEALKPYAHNGQVRAEIVRSIGSQRSPLVQVALAELMAALHEKSSLEELRKIMKSEDTPEDVKNKIREKIEVLI